MFRKEIESATHSKICMNLNIQFRLKETPKSVQILQISHHRRNPGLTSVGITGV